MGILLVGWSDRFLLESAKLLIETGAPVTHVTLLPGDAYKGLPGPYGPFFESRGVTFVDESRYYHRDGVLALPRDLSNPPSSKLLRDLFVCEKDFLTVTDRLCFNPISNALRRRLYYILVQHWLEFLRDAGIDTVIFSSTPHMGWDLVLWHLARHLGLRVTFFNRTLIPERILFHREIDSTEKVPEGYLQGLGHEALVERIGEPLFSHSRDDSAWAKYSRDMNSRMANGVRIEWKRLAWMLIRFRREVVISAFFFDRSVRTYGGLIPTYFRFWREQKDLHRLYHSRVSPPDYSAKYAFLALHFQPERSTMPEGGVFEDQILAVETLAASLPEGWQLYVKEHPRQFSLRFQSRHGRSEAFYLLLADIPRVRLIDTREDSGKLAQHAGFVATITGSIGWESIQMGKASLAFGTPWYYACRACRLVRSPEDCREAVAAILASSPEEVELDRLRYLAYLKERAVIASTSHEMALKSRIPYEELAANLALAMARAAGLEEGATANPEARSAPSAVGG